MSVTALFDEFSKMRDLLPGVMPVVLAWMIAIACMVSVTYVTLKLIFKREFRIALRMLKSATVVVLKEIAQGTDDPVKYHRLTPVFRFLGIVMQYLMMLLCLVFELWIGAILVLSTHRSFLDSTELFAALALFLVLAMYFKAQANKERIALNRDWKRWLLRRRRMRLANQQRKLAA